LKPIRIRTGKSREERDEFLSLTDRVKFYLTENTTRAYTALGVIGGVVILTVVVAIMLNQSHKNQLALQAEALAYYDIDSPSPGEADMTPEDRVKKARELFGKISDGGPFADVARFYGANADLELGELDQAMDEYKKLAASSEPVVSTVADVRLAAALKIKGDIKGALGVYKQMEEKGLLKDGAHYMSAQLYEDMGDTKQAIAEYSAVKDEFPGSPWRAEAETRLKELLPPEATAATEQPAAKPAKK